MKILKDLGVDEISFGASINNWWSSTQNEGLIESFNPSNGKLLGKIYQCSVDDYEHVILENQKPLKNGGWFQHQFVAS